jgi:hypothetical protein
MTGETALFLGFVALIVGSVVVVAVLLHRVFVLTDALRYDDRQGQDER